MLLEPFLNEMNPVCILIPGSLKIHFNIIHSSTFISLGQFINLKSIFRCLCRSKETVTVQDPV